MSPTCSPANRCRPAGVWRSSATPGDAGSSLRMPVRATASRFPSCRPRPSRNSAPSFSGGAVFHNPVELGPSATVDEYRLVLARLLGDVDIDAVIVTYTSPVLAGAEQVAGVLASVASAADKPVLANFAVTGRVLLALRTRTAAGPAVRLPRVGRRVRSPGSHPMPSGSSAPKPRRPASTTSTRPAPARSSRTPWHCSAAGGEGPSPPIWLDTPSAFALLESYRIPILRCCPVASVAEAVEAARSLGWPVALKLDAPTLVHKSDVGGVRLGLGSGDELAASGRGALCELRRRSASRGAAHGPGRGRDGRRPRGGRLVRPTCDVRPRRQAGRALPRSAVVARAHDHKGRARTR